MSEPWFKPDGILRFRPITRSGRIVLVITYLMVVVFGLGGFFLTDADSTGWWTTGAIAFAAFVIGHAIVLWKMDWGYGGR